MKLTVDYSGFCIDGKKIILEGIVKEEINIDGMLHHCKTCLVCNDIINSHIDSVVGSIPAPYSMMVSPILTALRGMA